MIVTYIKTWLVNKEPEAVISIQPSNIKRPAMSNALEPAGPPAERLTTLHIFNNNNTIRCSQFHILKV